MTSGETEGALAFRREWISRKTRTSPEKLRVMMVVGESMSPTIGNGDIVLVDEGAQGKELVEGRVYVIRKGEEIYVKRFRKGVGKLMFLGDNRDMDYLDVTVNVGDEDGFKVIGRVLWAGKEFWRDGGAMFKELVLGLSVLSFAAAPSFAAKPMYGVKAVGGDTIVARDGDSTVIIRLYGIDAPDEGQMGHKAGEAALKAEAVDGTTPLIVSQIGKDTDQYGRVQAIVTRDGTCINKRLVYSGAAVVNPEQCQAPECQEWLAVQEDAKRSKISFWAIPGQPMPWDERKAHYREVEDKETGYIEGVQYSIENGRVMASVPEMPKAKFVDYPRPIFVYGGGTTTIHRVYHHYPPPIEPRSRYRVY